MDRAQRLAGLWSWLPAFRAVAETEHLPTAAKAMHVSPSALSRSVTLLEGALGEPLFTRAGRRIQLNAAGMALLAAVRDAMRRVDDGLGEASTPRPSRLRIAGAPSWIGLLVVPLLGEHAIELEHVGSALAEVRGALLRGTVDLAIAETIPPGDDIIVERLGSIARAVCAARGRTPEAFAVSTETLDGWPAELPRAIALRTASLEPVLAACRSGVLRAVLPLAIARAHGLVPSRTPRLAPSQLYLARRVPIASGVDPFTSALHARARRLLRS